MQSRQPPNSAAISWHRQHRSTLNHARKLVELNIAGAMYLRVAAQQRPGRAEHCRHRPRRPDDGRASPPAGCRAARAGRRTGPAQRLTGDRKARPVILLGWRADLHSDYMPLMIVPPAPPSALMAI